MKDEEKRKGKTERKEESIEKKGGREEKGFFHFLSALAMKCAARHLILATLVKRS